MSGARQGEGEGGRGSGDDGPFDATFLASLSQLAFAVRRLRMREGEGAVRASHRGGRVEFADHRPYTEGDDPRFLDWAAYGRTGKLFVKEFEREDELSLLLLLDDSGSMSLHGKLRAAQRLTYALAYLGLAGGSRVRVGLCSDGDLRLSGEVSGTPRVRDLGRFLLLARGEGGTDLGRSVRAVPAARRGSRVIVLLSDMLTAADGRRELAVRSERGDEVNVLALWNAGDRELPRSGVLVLEDAETGERLTLPAAAAHDGAAELGRIEEDWLRFAAHHGLRYLPIDAAAPTEELVLKWLRAGGVIA